MLWLNLSKPENKLSKNSHLKPYRILFVKAYFHTTKETMEQMHDTDINSLPDGQTRYNRCHGIKQQTKCLYAIDIINNLRYFKNGYDNYTQIYQKLKII